MNYIGLITFIVINAIRFSASVLQVTQIIFYSVEILLSVNSYIFSVFCNHMKVI
jgi:hypothetical protein